LYRSRSSSFIDRGISHIHQLYKGTQKKERWAKNESTKVSIKRPEPYVTLGKQISINADAASRQTPLGLFAHVVIGFLMENPTSSPLQPCPISNGHLGCYSTSGVISPHLSLSQGKQTVKEK
jgi:hypothetical protein